MRLMLIAVYHNNVYAIHTIIIFCAANSPFRIAVIFRSARIRRQENDRMQFERINSFVVESVKRKIIWLTSDIQLQALILLNVYLFYFICKMHMELHAGHRRPLTIKLIRFAERTWEFMVGIILSIGSITQRKLSEHNMHRCYAMASTVRSLSYLQSFKLACQYEASTVSYLVTFLLRSTCQLSSRERHVGRKTTAPNILRNFPHGDARPASRIKSLKNLLKNCQVSQKLDIRTSS